MRGTNFQSDGILDSIEFSNPLRSSDLKTKFADFYDEIKAIKDANPKPS